MWINVTIFNITFFFLCKNRISFLFSAKILFLKDGWFAKLHTQDVQNHKRNDFAIAIGFVCFKEQREEFLFWGESSNNGLIYLLKVMSSFSLVGEGRGEGGLLKHFSPKNSIVIIFLMRESYS